MAQYVTISGNQFRLNGKTFYPMALNYTVSIVKNNGNYFVSPVHSYNLTGNYECNSMPSCNVQLKSEFDYIVGMGFNSLRLGFEPYYHPQRGLLFQYFPQNQSTDTMRLPVNPFNPTDPGLLTVFSLYDQILEVASAASLKIILLVTGSRPKDFYELTYKLTQDEIDLRNAFLDALSLHFSNAPNDEALMAYDLWNEPAYSLKIPPAKITKQEACEIISNWYDILKGNDPKRLITIGNCGTNDITAFDHTILKLDFNSLHYYPAFKAYEDRTDSSIQELARRRTINDLYWFNQTSFIPWIIGETGYTACEEYGISDGLDGTLAYQATYAQYSLDVVCNCGGIGYSWWAYQDVTFDTPGPKFCGNFFGLLERFYAPSPAAEKPAVAHFRNYPTLPQSTGICLVDYSPTFDANKLYYNRYGYPRNPQYEIERIVKDQDGNPIKDATILVRTYFGNDTIKLNGVVIDYPERDDHYYTHTDVNGKFIALPCPTKYGFVGTPTANLTPYVHTITVSCRRSGSKEMDFFVAYRWYK